jgi:NADPH:quinone reductase-like Zn-dependent oxidoreductase
MDAVVVTAHGGPEVLACRRVAVPVPTDGQVLVRVGACGVNNTDINTRIGWYERDDGADGDVAGWLGAAFAFPRIQGAAIAGRIAAVGPGVDRGRVAERVLVDPIMRDPGLPEHAQCVAYLGSELDGGYAQFTVVPAENARSVSSGLSDAELATFVVSHPTAEEMLRRAGVRAGETVLVTGASGSVGTALIELARLRGATVIAVASRAHGPALLDFGADRVIAREDLPGALEHAGHVDVVADVLGGSYVAPLLAALPGGGRFVTSGAISGPRAQIDMRDIVYKDLALIGVVSSSERAFTTVLRHLEAGVLRPLLAAALPLAEVATAQERLVRRAGIGKVVLTIGDRDGV